MNSFLSSFLFVFLLSVFLYMLVFLSSFEDSLTVSFTSPICIVPSYAQRSTRSCSVIFRNVEVLKEH